MAIARNVQVGHSLLEARDFKISYLKLESAKSLGRKVLCFPLGQPKFHELFNCLFVSLFPFQKVSRTM